MRAMLTIPCGSIFGQVCIHREVLLKRFFGIYINCEKLFEEPLCQQLIVSNKFYQHLKNAKNFSFKVLLLNERL